MQSFAHAQLVLQAEIDPLNRTVCRTTGMSPNDRWDKALQDGMTVMQPAPCTALLDLHLALHYRRRRNTDNPVDFAGRSWAIAPTHRKTVGIIHHPDRQFWVVTEPPLAVTRTSLLANNYRRMVNNPEWDMTQKQSGR